MRVPEHLLAVRQPSIRLAGRVPASTPRPMEPETLARCSLTLAASSRIPDPSIKIDSGSFVPSPVSISTFSSIAVSESRPNAISGRSRSTLSGVNPSTAATRSRRNSTRRSRLSDSVTTGTARVHQGVRAMAVRLTVPVRLRCAKVRPGGPRRRARTARAARDSPAGGRSGRQERRATIRCRIPARRGTRPTIASSPDPRLPAAA